MLCLWFTVGPCCSSTDLLLSHTQVRGVDTAEKGWSITLRSLLRLQACLGECMSPPGGSLWRAAPFPLSGLRKETPNERHASVEVGCQAVGGKTEVMSICSKLWTLTSTPMGAIWSQQWKYGVGGGSVWTSSEAKPSLTHSRDSWETHPTSKQTYWEREHRAVPSQLSHGGQLTSETWSEWCSETSAATCWNMTWIHAVILPLIPLWLHSKQIDNCLTPPPSPQGMATPYEGNIHAISHVTEAVADLWHFQLRGEFRRHKGCWEQGAK